MRHALEFRMGGNSDVVRFYSTISAGSEKIEELVEEDRIYDYGGYSVVIYTEHMKYEIAGKEYRQWKKRVFSPDDSYNVLLDYYIPEFNDKREKEEK